MSCQDVHTRKAIACTVRVLGDAHFDRPISIQTTPGNPESLITPIPPVSFQAAGDPVLYTSFNGELHQNNAFMTLVLFFSGEELPISGSGLFQSLLPVLPANQRPIYPAIGTASITYQTGIGATLPTYATVFIEPDGKMSFVNVLAFEGDTPPGFTGTSYQLHSINASWTIGQ